VRAAITKGIREMEVVEVSEPAEPGPGEVIVRPEAVGICGSDFHFYLGELDIFEGSPFPRVQGHEVAAKVEAVGPGSDERLRVGGRVALHPLSSCGRCYPCSVGRGNVCDNFSLIGIHEDGGLQELLRLPAAQVFPIEADEPAVAALAEPVSIGVRAVHRAGIREGERVVVLGAGPIGQSVALLARDHGATTLLIDPLESRLELSGEMGAEAIPWSEPEEVVAAAREWAGGEGAPVVFDATGAPGAIRAAVEIAASAGRVVVVGMSGEEVPIAVMSFVDKELDVLGVSCCGGEEFAEAVDVVERHAVSLQRWISHRFSLEESPAALQHAMENPTEVMKVVIQAG
jgi:2-desacetyl-2-hydroxyethyl bacteriochlorophyllide A dehydrogenase